MKDLIPLRTSDDVIDFVRGLWRTEIFQKSPYIDEWVQRMARHPAVFADMSDVDLEHPHFATWFGMTYRRRYADPTISDLYYLHELVHSCLLTYEPSLRFTAWYRKMTSIELAASLETECYVYLGAPGLREISFKDEIWADRYLGGQSRLGDSLRDVVRQDRFQAMQHPDPMDYCEQQIAAYARQNFEWANGWKVEAEPGRPAYREVEEHMAGFRAGVISLDGHIEWLWRSGEIPFPTQAELFAPVYWKNKISVRLRAHAPAAPAPSP
ncbi:MAG TPA: hypothetical protein VK698_12065 [Kofleriaceae bacterium]|nr:hypothetical protein [Kofleriaceae bacterium]